ncbi:MAG TPA: class I SAM-dependent methyltransferase [Terriglobia bacterium]|nr:class I SAM-dependent methyltransferase [Terriglobia bacterium]
MGEELESVACALCSGQDSRVVIRGPGALQVVQCRHDGLLYMSPRPQAKDTRNFHRHFVREDNLVLFDAYRRRVLQREAAAIKRRRNSGTLLDVGCGTGTFFENFDARHWRLYGVDTSRLGVEVARERYQTEAFCGTLQEAQYAPGSFDVVTVLDTLYYCSDPVSMIGEAHRVLKDDGVLAVEVPGYRYTLFRDKGPVCWLLDGKRMRGFTSSHHLYYFAPKTLKLLLTSAGFRIIEMIPEQASLAQAWFGSCLNEIHFLLAKALFSASRGRVSIAGKEFYLAVKAHPGIRHC